jgi:hypothetical protein
MNMLNNAVHIPVVSTVFFIGKYFVKAALGQLFKQACKVLGIVPGFMQ